MPLNYIHEIEVFNVWCVDFMGPPIRQGGNKHIFVAVNYVSKWIEAIPSPTHDVRVVTKFLKRVIFR